MLLIRIGREHITFLEQSIATLDAEIGAYLEPYKEAQQLTEYSSVNLTIQC